MEMQRWYAHSGKSGDQSDWQLLVDHLQATEHLAGRFGKNLGLESVASLSGLFHDLGKYDPDFPKVLRGENVRVDHSTAGAWALIDLAPPPYKLVAEIAGYAICGHHAGLPDKRNATNSCLAYRIENYAERLDPAWKSAVRADFTQPGAEIMSRLRRNAHFGFDMSVAVRMIFSCLVDADYRDTEAYYSKLEGRTTERDWPDLRTLLPRLTDALNTKIAGFSDQTDLNILRAEILDHVRGNSAMTPGLFTLNVPTGGGKTLASMAFALDHAEKYGHSRIIYGIPYTSITDQTATIFREMFGAGIVLEHHSAIDDEKTGFAGRDKIRLAMEDWAAPIVVTTNVQLFESLFAARPSRARKLHNIANSVIILDEAQCLPRKLLLPTLRMIDTLATHYGCSIVLCTATQPAFDSRQLKAGGLPLEGRELAPEPDRLARRLRRAHIVQAGEMDDSALIDALAQTPQGLVIVNSRAHALELFRAAKADGLEGLIHLSTRQYATDRGRIIEDIRKRLKNGDHCRVIATSLVEAGVDFDFPKGWRAEAGLDSIIQAAGRVNREGKRPLADSVLTVFSASGRSAPKEVKSLAADMRRVAGRQDDLLAPEAIRDWFNEVYWRTGADQLGDDLVSLMNFSPTGGTDFSFRELAEKYRMIESLMTPVVVPRDDDAREWVNKLGIKEISSGAIARALQNHMVQIPQSARERLRACRHATFRNQDLRGDQFCVLETQSLYHDDSGLWWEDADYLADEAGIV